MEHESHLRQIAKEYLSARKRFRDAVIEHPELGGNDNLVGRIGEFVALNYLTKQNRIVEKCKSATNPGYDLTCKELNKISVKTITFESKSGKSTKIRLPFDELIMVYIGEGCKVEKLGHLEKNGIDRAIREGHFRFDNKADKKFLNDKGLFDTYGILLKDEQVEDLL